MTWPPVAGTPPPRPATHPSIGRPECRNTGRASLECPPVGGAECRRIVQEGSDVAGKFVLTKGKSGQYHFNLKAGNGEIIATSESYKSKAAALNGIESVKKNAADAKVDDQTGE
jgi:uncharacterized protein YegP (UPF0339 family)